MEISRGVFTTVAGLIGVLDATVSSDLVIQRVLRGIKGMGVFETDRQGLGLQVVETVDRAEFILVHGTEALGLSSGDSVSKKLAELEKILEQCAAKGIPMVVANPDFVTVEARELRIMPGTLASTYEKLGGEVKWMGKPYPIIYKFAIAMAGVDASDSIAVGDSLHHDIKGANASGIESAFITCGIHLSELGLKEFGEPANLSSVHNLALKYDAYPSYVLPSFTW
ncbi:uncharacterized protein LOC143576116 [Bidens hawaiensis]|uniref:uncharacterized protein LOC143576116 n=1 Tax=Bidens hawaiensis TaxID=980011 RepID=UPI00404AA25A